MIFDLQSTMSPIKDIHVEWIQQMHTTKMYKSSLLHARSPFIQG